MKLYDFDGLFDEKLKDYMAKRAGKYGAVSYTHLTLPTILLV